MSIVPIEKTTFCGSTLLSLCAEFLISTLIVFKSVHSVVIGGGYSWCWILFPVFAFSFLTLSDKLFQSTIRVYVHHCITISNIIFLFLNLLLVFLLWWCIVIFLWCWCIIVVINYNLGLWTMYRKLYKNVTECKFLLIKIHCLFYEFHYFVTCKRPINKLFIFGLKWI